MMKKKCDLVMKGGITSGIVYPGAVLELSKDYQFVNIGGTSAGAIAAALTAAAEYRRQTGGGDAGFARIAELPAWMAERVDGRSRLLRLFEPEGETRALFEVALAWIEEKRWSAVLRALLRGFPAWGSIAAFLGVALMVVAGLAADHVAIVVVIAALLIVTLIAVIVACAAEAVAFANRVLPRRGFGVSGGKALANWLSGEIDGIAGVAHPLTFGDLRRAGINLEMMTTNLTHGRPYRLPFEGRYHFHFTEAEMRDLFDDRVVAAMLARAKAKDATYELSADDLPVVVATRMSLSFPVLLSAVPLWSIDHGVRSRHYRRERCWFSDGGISSNFPVHFFDRSMPRWPTFAINLAPHTPRYHTPGQRTYLPATNLGGILEWWAPIGSVAAFVARIVSTMQNWRDNMLLRLPGQRDRIAHVLLAAGEGGLNLAMDEETIRALSERGAEAGRRLRTEFRWRNHRWVRYRAFMTALEETLESWEGSFDAGYHELLAGPDELPSCKVTAGQRATMHEASLAFLAHVRQNFGRRPFRKPRACPKEQPVLRMMPRT